MIRRPPRSTLDRSAAASDVYKRQGHGRVVQRRHVVAALLEDPEGTLASRELLAAEAHVDPRQWDAVDDPHQLVGGFGDAHGSAGEACLLYTSDAADERSSGDLGGRRIIKQKKRARRDG